MLYFLTSNPGKFAEAQKWLPEVQQLDVDLDEVQSLDLQVIVEHKLKQAREHHSGLLLTEDTGLFIEALNGFPGPLIKWLLKSLNKEGIAELVHHYKNHTAYAETALGYSDENGQLTFFKGCVEGKIVKPRGESGFGWDAIFEVKGTGKTFAEMGIDEKNVISHRGKAFKDFMSSFSSRFD